jgi:starvation-inducible outer membrane lipoprotein
MWHWNHDLRSRFCTPDGYAVRSGGVLMAVKPARGNHLVGVARIQINELGKPRMSRLTFMGFWMVWLRGARNATVRA